MTKTEVEPEVNSFPLSSSPEKNSHSVQRSSWVKRFNRTDAGNAELFTAMFRDEVRYDHRRDRWLVWQGHWWDDDLDGSVVRRAKAVARWRAQAAWSLDEGDERTREIKWAARTEACERLRAILKLAQTEHPIADDGTNWDSNPTLLGVSNGVVDLTTGKLRDGRQSDRVTMHTQVRFDPDAKASRWEQFLLEVFLGNKEVVEYVQKAVGYSLTGDVSEQVFFLAYGAGANGKSTFLEVLRHVLGDYSYNLPFSAFELKARSAIPNEIAALSRRRFVTAIETNESVELNEGRIKALTGSDPITARFLFQEFFTFNPTGKFWLAFNHKPKVSDDSAGFWRRVCLIPFLKEFSQNERDQELLGKLKSEAAGILKWAVEGALKWQKHGLKAPELITSASESYRKESDPIKEFIEEDCELCQEYRISAMGLWSAYLTWAERHHERPLARQVFSQKLEMRGFKKARVGHDRTWTWFGIRLRERSLLPTSLRADADVESPLLEGELKIM